MLNLTDYFDKVYVINLDCRPDRLDTFKERVEKAGITGFTRFRAVHGDTCQPPVWYRYPDANMNGAWGCLMTHVMIAYDAMMNGAESYLVFEDDVCFSDDFADRLPKILEQANNLRKGWDMLYLGGQHLYRETRSPEKIEDTDLIKCFNINRTHAFAVNKRYMLKFSQHIIHAPDYIDNRYYNDFLRHVDHQIGEQHSWIETIAPIDWLCGQGGGNSNVNGEDKGEEWWHDKGW